MKWNRPFALVIATVCASVLLASLPAQAQKGGGMDSTPEVSAFARTLEEVCISTIESGQMTKDLALLVGKDQPFQNTQEFLAALDENLRKAMAS